ncbi:two-component system, NtrC family, nitrogen regulation sensor histidine kinase GlnL [Steroidobacter denitrificans]|uniref:Sensory histidine kinase/phosphatase NtrB n=2 Tax=Steroidobacter denitrificans TaxID=465721 RepID=A0A127FDN9_STEDE|nr:two-component system, NtrC family, nitrogen regulation sensor histidine kinase GlnL [Steroidobacter denitrificans]
MRVPSESARVLDNLSTCVLIIDGAHSLQYLNAAAEALLGIGRNQASGRALSELLWDSGGLEEVIDRALQAGQPYSRRELSLHARQGDGLLIVDCTVTPYEYDTLPGAALIEISDATQHRRLTRETALLTQVGGSRMMIRQLAHEIKNPLGGLRGAAQLLARQLDDEAMREYTSVIISEADRLAALVDALLGPGRAPHKEPVNIHELLQHVGRLLAAGVVPDAHGDVPVDALPDVSREAVTFITAQDDFTEIPGLSSKLVIERDYDPSLPPLMLDRHHLIQVLLNLGRNALQAVSQNPDGRGRLVLRTRALTNVSIGARRHRVVASIQFQDNGPGVPEELRDALFYPLVTGRTDGTGLGLAIAQDLVSRHGGLIEFESRPGLTTFTILLPFHATDTAETP